MLDTLTAYVRLRDSVRKTLLEGQRLIELQKVKTYWETGCLINRHILQHKDRANYGVQVIRKLSEDLKVSERVLYQVHQFARAFPILNGRSKLTWTHYRALSRVEDPKERARLIDQVEREHWAGDLLASEISKRSQDIREITPPPKTNFRFIPKRGKLDTYQTVQTEQGLLLDLGFSTFIQRAGLEKLPIPPKSDLHTYRATVEKVIDADTLWTRIDLGFHIFVRQKLRLRGLDSPELNTPAGQKAKKFVETQLKLAGAIIVTTTKPDKYDRYLSDIWIGDVNLNKLLLEQGLAKPMGQITEEHWTDLNMGRF